MGAASGRFFFKCTATVLQLYAPGPPKWPSRQGCQVGRPRSSAPLDAHWGQLHRPGGGSCTAQGGGWGGWGRGYHPSQFLIRAGQLVTAPQWTQAFVKEGKPQHTFTDNVTEQEYLCPLTTERHGMCANYLIIYISIVFEQAQACV